MMKIELKRLDDAFHFESTNEAGNAVQSDGSEVIGGSNQGMRPMQMVLAALGSCSSIDVVYILRKMRQPLDDIQVTITAEREKDKTPSLFESIHVHYTLTGDLNEKKVEQAVSMSMETYCSVARLLEKTAKLSWDWEVVNRKTAKS